MKRILWLFFQSELGVLKKNLIFAEVNKNLPELAVCVSMLGENPTNLKLAVDNVNLSLWDLRDLSAFFMKEDSVINSVTLVSFSYHS